MALEVAIEVSVVLHTDFLVTQINQRAVRYRKPCVYVRMPVHGVHAFKDDVHRADIEMK